MFDDLPCMLPFAEYATAHFASSSPSLTRVLRLNHGGAGRLWIYAVHGCLVRAYY